jgi:MFS family permease
MARALTLATSSSMKLWLWPLAATLVLQTMSAFLQRAMPTLGPVLTGEAGLAASTIGHFAALNTVGSIAFLLIGAPLIRRAGAIRTLQLGTLCSAVGILLVLWPHPLTLIVGSLLIGVGYGPSPPAGSDILHRYAPKHRRALIFSIKQAGVPLGGVLAGLVLPLFAAADWRLAILTAAGLGLLSVAIVQPVRGNVDRERDNRQALSFGAFLSPSNFIAPFRALALSPALPRLAAASIMFAVAQGVLFAFFVTYGVTDLGLSLAAAGAIFAIMQATGIGGRVLLGWVADRAGSALSTLICLTLASALTTAMLAASTALWPTWTIVLLAGVAGITVGSWNGIFLAEVARVSPPGHIPAATAGATLVCFLGYVLGPTLFALIVEAAQSYRLGFALVTALSLAAAPILWPLLRSELRPAAAE